jgi:hypothetical protein
VVKELRLREGEGNDTCAKTGRRLWHRGLVRSKSIKEEKLGAVAVLHVFAYASHLSPNIFSFLAISTDCFRTASMPQFDRFPVEALNLLLQ